MNAAIGGNATGSGPDSEGDLALAEAVVAALQRCGATEVVVCAGARNAALVAVLAATPSLRLWSFPEERSAGFFALGRALAREAPVAVVTTSGTAVAELLPAVIEAHYQGVPMIMVTADRPRGFRGTGAPQAIEQAGLFSGYVAAAGDVATVAEWASFEEAILGWDGGRPMHWNICLEEPSADALARARPVTAESRPAPKVPRADAETVEKFLGDSAAGPLVAVVAALPTQEQVTVARFLQRLGCPVIAEATSGLREWHELAGQHVFAGEATLARLPVGRVLRIGGVPSSRWWRDLECRPSVRVLSLTASGFPGLARPSAVSGFPDWDQVVIPTDWRVAQPWDPEAARLLATTLAEAIDGHPRGEPALVHALSRRIPWGSLVFLGNSLPIREWNVFATTGNRFLRCHANRGANGIDGCVSTFLGLGTEEETSWAVIGDLTALYDLAALWITPALPAARRNLASARRRIAIINNGGGRIFSRVAALRELPATSRRFMENPHGLAFHAWADLFGWGYAKATTPDEIGEAAERRDPNLILEIVPDPAETEAAWACLAKIKV
ncbi:MAG: 2-succinyl-5-enolpyruvyl-6-hydroxy-3-cyclohexene-1-carboxylic-acid synthase [Verrucomicrobiales bacterium]